jgi:chromosome segregation ATPase
LPQQRVAKLGGSSRSVGASERARAAPKDRHGNELKQQIEALKTKLSAGKQKLKECKSASMAALSESNKIIKRLQTEAKANKSVDERALKLREKNVKQKEKNWEAMKSKLKEWMKEARANIGAARKAKTICETQRKQLTACRGKKADQEKIVKKLEQTVMDLLEELGDLQGSVVSLQWKPEDMKL